MASRFRTQYDKPTRYHVEPGVRVRTLYGPIFDDLGIMHLTEIGKHDLYGEIQSHAQSVDIHVLLAMYNNGDTEALSRIQGAYGDFTSMPTTFAEALNTMIAAQNYFDSLPVEVKDRFGHSFNRFLASMDSPTWASDAGIDFPSPPVASVAPDSGAAPSSAAPSSAAPTGPDPSLAAGSVSTPVPPPSAGPN